MVMPGRTYSANSEYRYGFNGKENDKEISEGGQDYGMRIYDTRLGRFLSTDPLKKSYPMLSTYQFASNSPIAGIDVDGLEFELYYTKSIKENGKTVIKAATHVDSYEATLELKGTINSTYTFLGFSKTFSKGFTIDVPYSIIGLQPIAVDHNGEWLVLPDGVNKDNLPSYDDPVWSSFETMEQFGERVAGKLNAILQTIKDAKDIGDACVGLLKAVEAGKAKGETLNLESNTVREKHLRQLEKGRPERYRKGVVEKAWEDAKGADGKVRDPKTGKEITWDRSKSRDGQWDMGHKPGKEYDRLKQDYINGKITWKDYLNEYNNPANYTPELPPSNRSNNKKPG
jgi:RHS repeat-associated protein